MTKIKNVVLPFGLPTSGKGSIGKSMARDFMYTPWIMRNMIKTRREAEAQDDFKKHSEAIEKKGGLLDDCTIFEIVTNQFRSSPHVLFDGMPRNYRQALWLMNFLFSTHRVQPSQIHLIHLMMTSDECIQRFLDTQEAEDRRGRLDSELSIHEHRIKVHLENEPSTLDYLRSVGVTIHEVSAMQTPERVWSKVQGILYHAQQERQAVPV